MDWGINSVFTNRNKKISLLRYWTIRYLATLFTGLLVIAIISVFWIRHTTLENKLNVTKFLAQEIADRTVQNEMEPDFHKGRIPNFIDDRRRFLNLESTPAILIVDPFGRIVSTNLKPRDLKVLPISAEILENEKELEKTKFLNETFYIVKNPIEIDEVIVGFVVIIQNEKDLVQVNQEYRLLAIMLLSLAILGWLAIYFLTRKLSKPIQDVAFAAKKIEKGSYDISLPVNPKEKEVYELISSFEQMANRLQQLEALRAELLAGVTHELKTPVTSISGLLQAVKDDVVTGKDAKEFLDISLKETARMQKMVADLLEFNSFTANAVPVMLEEHNVNELLQEITYQWSLIEENRAMKLTFAAPTPPIYTNIDATRLQQIVVNLLNNAKQAMTETDNRIISVKMNKKEDEIVTIDISDNGHGIPSAEQELIFERFFRGEEKKYKVRGLGLGLSFSKMLAQAMGGDLYLKETSPKGTTFTIILNGCQTP